MSTLWKGSLTVPYIPTQEELSQLGFPVDAWRGIVVATSDNPRGGVFADTELSYESANGFTAWTIYAREGSCGFYPQSADDVATLIRLLTPPKSEATGKGV